MWSLPPPAPSCQLEGPVVGHLLGELKIQELIVNCVQSSHFRFIFVVGINAKVICGIAGRREKYWGEGGGSGRRDM